LRAAAYPGPIHRPRAANPEPGTMIAIAALIAIGLFAYLFYALIRPERF
jgi:K+-transporting ATPase KdpF subunit